MGFTPPTGVSSVTLPKTSIPCVPYLRTSQARPADSVQWFLRTTPRMPRSFASFTTSNASHCLS